MSEPSVTDQKMTAASVETESKLAKIMFGWTSQPRTGFFVLIAIAVSGVLLFLADFLIDRHEYLPLAEFPAFYALFGFLALSGIVVSGWPLRRLLVKPETYYEPEDQTHD